MFLRRKKKHLHVCVGTGEFTVLLLTFPDFVDDNQTVEVWYCIYRRFSQQQSLLSEALVCKLRCDTQGAPLDADEFSSCWCDS